MSTVGYTRGYARVTHSRQCYNYNMAHRPVSSSPSMFTEQVVVSIQLYTPSVPCMIAYIVVFCILFCLSLRVYCHRITLVV